MGLEDQPHGKKEGADMKPCPICDGKGKGSDGYMRKMQGRGRSAAEVREGRSRPFAAKSLRKKN